jgi:hypothetical protein
MSDRLKVALETDRANKEQKAAVDQVIKKQVAEDQDLTSEFISPSSELPLSTPAVEKLVLETSGRTQFIEEMERRVIKSPIATEQDLTSELTSPSSQVHPVAQASEKSELQTIRPAQFIEGLDASNHGQLYDKDDLFKDSHRINLDVLAHKLLATRSGITLLELCQHIAQRHGLKKTSNKQLEHVHSIVKGWAGIADGVLSRKTVWAEPDQVTDLIEWRGVSPFGEQRYWKEIAYQEQLGLAKAALINSPLDPIEWMFCELKLSRRRERTADEFRQWIDTTKRLLGQDA